MKTCEYAGAPWLEPRSHPWVGTPENPDCRYYDLTAGPRHIRSSLEDFQPWSQYAAIEEFYTLLERLNHPKSALESNDCAFSGPSANDDRAVRKPLQCSGRVMLLFRVLRRNTEQGRIEWLKNQLHADLASVDPTFQWGIIGTSIVPVRYCALSADGDQQLGSQLMICFWAWGDSESDTMLNLGRLFVNLAQALRKVRRRLDDAA